MPNCRCQSKQTFQWYSTTVPDKAGNNFSRLCNCWKEMRPFLLKVREVKGCCQEFWGATCACAAWAHQMEPLSLLISWVNPFLSRFINRTIYFCNALESDECACWLLSFLYFHWLFPLSARETSPGNRSIYKSTRKRVDSKGLYGRCRLHLVGSCARALPSSIDSDDTYQLQSAATLKSQGLWTDSDTLVFTKLQWGPYRSSCDLQSCENDRRRDHAWTDAAG